MTRADDRILDLLRDADIAANPSTIAFNIDYDNAYISNRCLELAEGGLLDRVGGDKPIYEITDRGIRYLDDELTDDDEAALEAMD